MICLPKKREKTRKGSRQTKIKLNRHKKGQTTEREEETEAKNRKDQEERSMGLEGGRC